AEDGIRYFHVTGVQTCALPISHPPVDRLGDAPIGGAGHSGTEHRSLDPRAVAFGQPAEVGAAVDEGAAPQNEEVAGVPGHLHVRPWEEAAGGFEHRLVPQVVVAHPSDAAGVPAAI